MMRWLAGLSAGLLAALAVAQQQVTFSTFTPSTVIKSTNLTDLVQWDGYSLFVQGQRITLWSGEIHPWRILTPALYLDVMQRIKALGFNAISMYTFWGIHNPAPGVLDFDDWKDLDPFFDAANEAGLWVVARPGPYINAEVSGGGIPGWVTALNVSLRTSDPAFREAYEPYWAAVGEIFTRHQITEGGPIIGVQIDNEYFLDDDGSLDLDYIETLENLMRSYGIVVPLTFNDVAKEYRLVEGQGAVDIYGVDSYPQNTDCSDPNRWKDVQTSFRQYFQDTSGKVGSPFYIPEFQGGWIPGIDTKGYEQCQALFDADFQKVFYHSNIAQGVRMHNVYMVYGGTNYGHTAFPRGITSYDYWAAIAEDRSLKPKYRDLKSMSHFIRSSRDLAKTWVTGNNPNSYTNAPSGTIRVDELRNPDTDAGFYIVRHENSSSTETTSFEITLNDRDGDVKVPVTLRGRDSRILVTNYCWSQSCVAYSSAAILTTMVTSEFDILIVHGAPDQPYQVAFPHSNATFDQLSGSSRVDAKQLLDRTVLNFNISKGDHSTFTIEGGEKLLHLHVLDTAVADYVWEAVLPGEGPFGAHYGIGSNQTVVVFGPYFLRSASLDPDGTTVHLHGDLSGTTQIYIAAANTIRNFTWNDEPIAPVQGANLLWSVVLPGPDVPTEAPQITGWRWTDSLPELANDFDDSKWVTADHVTTYNPIKPYEGYNGKYVLYLQDYGYAVGITLLRGHFTGTGEETGFAVSVSVGTGGAAAFWLNGRYLGSALVDKEEGIEDVNTTVSFPKGSVRTGHNVLLIVLDNAALEENNKFTAYSSDIQSPRGLRGYTLLGGDQSGHEMYWKVQGNLGGWTDFPDRVRSIYNTGGLAGEREGWHLPGFDDKDGNWQDGFADLTEPGVRFYRASVEIDYPAKTDIHYSFVFPNSTGGYRAQLYVNGWQFGRRYGDYGKSPLPLLGGCDTADRTTGPQTVFPVPPGILVQGNNTIALSFFGMNDTAESLTLGGELTVRIDPDVTTSSLDLAGMRVPSPSWSEVYG